MTISTTFLSRSMTRTLPLAGSTSIDPPLRSRHVHLPQGSHSGPGFGPAIGILITTVRSHVAGVSPPPPPSLSSPPCCVQTVTCKRYTQATESLLSVLTKRRGEPPPRIAVFAKEACGDVLQAAVVPTTPALSLYSRHSSSPRSERSIDAHPVRRAAVNDDRPLADHGELGTVKAHGGRAPAASAGPPKLKPS